MENCVFCKIIKGELSAYKIDENELFCSFLSIGPLKSGHSLIIPKIHVDDFFEMEERSLQQILIYAKKISLALKKAFSPKSGKVGLMVAGLEVPHAHLHLIPMDSLEDLDFSNAGKASAEELKEIQQKILSVLN